MDDVLTLLLRELLKGMEISLVVFHDDLIDHQFLYVISCLLTNVDKEDKGLVSTSISKNEKEQNIEESNDNEEKANEEEELENVVQEAENEEKVEIETYENI